MNKVIDRQEDLWRVVKEEGYPDDRILRLKQIIHPYFCYDVSPDANRVGRSNDLYGNIDRLHDYTSEALVGSGDDYLPLLTSLFENRENNIHLALVALVNQYVGFCEETNAALHTSTTNESDSD